MDARPSAVMLSARIRHERNRQDKIDVSLATANLILAGFCSNTDVLSAVAHMFTEDEIAQIRQEQEDRAQLAVQQAQLARLRMMAHDRGSHN